MYTVDLRVDGQNVVLSNEASVRRAIVRGDLTRQTRVIVDDNGREDFVGEAVNYRWLRDILNEVSPLPGAETAPELVARETERSEPPAEDEREVHPSSESDKDNDAGLTANAPVQTRKDVDGGPRESVASPSAQAMPVRPRGEKLSSPWGWIVVIIGILVFLGIAVASSSGGGDSGDSNVTVPDAPAVRLEPQLPVLQAGLFHEWSADDSEGVTYKVGDLTVQLFTSLNDGLSAPTARITDADGQTYQVMGAGGNMSVRARFAVGDLDGGQRADDLILTSFTGGAHCCTDIAVVTKIQGAWRTVDFGMWDGDGMWEFPRNLGGDASPEFEFVDNAFLYAFASYAGSQAPTVIMKLRSGQAVDVSSDPTYRQVHINRMAELERVCKGGSNSACAAYVASAARAGQMSPAWSVMLSNYRGDDDWQYPTGCAIPTEDECPASFVVRFDSFPESLQHFLGQGGYASKAYIPSPNSAGKPSFDCAGVTNGVLKLVCEYTELADFDRQMAISYTRALAFSHDRMSLQRDQQAFISRRDALPHDPYEIIAAYKERLVELKGG